jgi:RimJ/RimL family protein N-acetyltransferase
VNVNSSHPTSLNWKPALQPIPVTLRGRFVILEPLDAGRHTAALWQAVQGRDELWSWMGDGPYATEEEFRRSLAIKQSAPDAVFLAIVPIPASHPEALQAASRPQGREAAGYASFMRIDPANGVVEVGNILLAPRLQRTTAATEAMYLMASHIFDHLGYRRYEWKCNAENLPSRRAALRLGFTFEGIFRQHMVVKGRNRDTAWFSMLDREWPARKRAFESWLDPANFDPQGSQRQALHSMQIQTLRAESE